MRAVRRVVVSRTVLAGVLVTAAVGAGCAPPTVPVPPERSGSTRRVTLPSDDGPIAAEFDAPDVNHDGRFVAFTSAASNVVAGDTNSAHDVFVWDASTGRSERVSVSSDGVEGTAASYGNGISADGRFVVFTSSASNLVGGDHNADPDVFLRDRSNATTERISVSGDGTEGDGSSGVASISADGRFVSYLSTASDLVPGDTNGLEDLFLRDRATGATRRVNVSPDGLQADAGTWGASLSADGRFIAFATAAWNLAPDKVGGPRTVDVFVVDTVDGSVVRVSQESVDAAPARPVTPRISADGRFVAYTSWASELVPGDTDGLADVLLWDRTDASTTRISPPVDGQIDGSALLDAMSADGRFVAYSSTATNTPSAGQTGSDVHVWDAVDGSTRQVSVTASGADADGASGPAAISGDGRFVAFRSTATNIIPGMSGRNVFLWDRLAG